MNIKTNFDNLLLDFKINDKKVITKLVVNFKRNNKDYKKNIYCIMSSEMEENILSPNNTQYFSDVTYYCVPPNNKKYRLYVLMAFNKDKYKSTLCCLALISNENFETFYTIF